MTLRDSTLARMIPMTPLNKLPLMILAMVFLLPACSSLPVTRAVWSSEPSKVPEAAWIRDEDSGLEWLVTNDTLALYLQLGVKDPYHQMLLRNAGLTVYLDPSGSKGKELLIRYPYAPKPQARSSRRSQPMLTPALSTDLLWQRNGDQLILNPHLERTEFKANIEEDRTGKLIFSLRIPLDSLMNNGSKTEAVAIGIEFFSPERPSGGLGMSMGTRGQTAGRPGGRASGERGERRGTGSPGGRPSLAVSGPVWFLARLAVEM